MLCNSWIADIMTCHKTMRTERFRSLYLREREFAIEADHRQTASGRRADLRCPNDVSRAVARERRKLTAMDGLRVLATLVKNRVA